MKTIETRLCKPRMVHADGESGPANQRAGKLKLNVHIDSPVHVAGGSLSGRLEVVSSTNKSLKLGEIAVELAGYEGTPFPRKPRRSQ